MAFCSELVAGKLRRWEGYLNGFRLPEWKDIPDFGLYMNQLIDLLKKYLDYLPPELKEEQFITAATINNYVRTKVMPEPRKANITRQSRSPIQSGMTPLRLLFSSKLNHNSPEL